MKTCCIKTTKEFWGRLPQVSAVYCLWSRKHGVLYVGRASNLFKRWAPYWLREKHHCLASALALRGCMLSWVECPKQYLGVLEQMAILLTQPRWNLCSKEFPAFDIDEFLRHRAEVESFCGQFPKNGDTEPVGLKQFRAEPLFQPEHFKGMWD